MANRSQAPTASAHGSTSAPLLQGGWLTRGEEGRFSVYLPRDGEVVRWTEEPDGGWSGPVSLGGDGLTPFLAVGQGADRYVHLVGLRPTAGDEGHVELVHSIQFQTGRPAVAWRSIGHSNGKGPWTGNPAVAVDAQGRAYAFVRNGGGGLSVRAQKDAGGWHPWWDLHGSGTDASPVAAVNGQGRVELLTATAKGLLRYVQEEPGAKPVRQDVVPAEAAPGTLAAVTGPSGHVTLFYCDKDGGVRAWSPGRGLAPTRLADAIGTGRIGRDPLSDRRLRLHGPRPAVGRRPARPRRLPERAGGVGRALVGDRGAARAAGDGPHPGARRPPGRDGPGRMGTLITTRQKAAADGLLLESWRPVG